MYLFGEKKLIKSFSQVDTLKVECQREKCPILDCASDQQMRPDALACCMVNMIFKKMKMF